MHLLIVVPALVVGGADAYQAVTGHRLSKRPSVRSNRRMRVESAIAAVVLIALSVTVLVR